MTVHPRGSIAGILSILALCHHCDAFIRRHESGNPSPSIHRQLGMPETEANIARSLLDCCHSECNQGVKTFQRPQSRPLADHSRNQANRCHPSYLHYHSGCLLQVPKFFTADYSKDFQDEAVHGFGSHLFMLEDLTACFLFLPYSACIGICAVLLLGGEGVLRVLRLSDLLSASWKSSRKPHISCRTIQRKLL